MFHSIFNLHYPTHLPEQGKGAKSSGSVLIAPSVQRMHRVVMTGKTRLGSLGLFDNTVLF